MVADSDTRMRILEVARDRFLAGGLGGMSMRKVADEVGVSATAIYRHYESKEALLLAVAEEGFRLFADYLWRALDADSPAERLRKAGRQYCAFALDHDRYYRVMFLTPCDELSYDDMSERTAETMAPTFRFLVDRVSECMADGYFATADPEAVSLTIWAHVHGLVSLYLLDHLGPAMDSDDSFRDFFAASLEQLFGGLLARS